MNKKLEDEKNIRRAIAAENGRLASIAVLKAQVLVKK